MKKGKQQNDSMLIKREKEKQRKQQNEGKKILVMFIEKKKIGQTNFSFYYD